MLAVEYSTKYSITIELARVLVELEEREIERGENYTDQEKEIRRICRLIIWATIGILPQTA